MSITENVETVEALQLALQLIEEAVAKEKRDLDLSNLNLKSVPSEIAKLKDNLTELYLSFNDLKSLPTTIGDLTNLEVLHLDNNSLESITGIEKLTKLTELSLNHNKLQSLPSEIGELTNLKIFRLTHNNLKSLPIDSIKNLTNLKDLQVTQNPLEWPPPDIVKKGTKSILKFCIDLYTYPKEIESLYIKKFKILQDKEKKIQDNEKKIQDKEKELEDAKRDVERASNRGLSQEPIDLNYIFVIMPLAEKDTYDAIKRAAEKVDPNLKAEGVNDKPGAIAITDEINRSIQKAGMIICDLTGERPNVYYELGYARGLGKQMICIAREGTTLHFDVSVFKTIFFKTYGELEKNLKDDIAKMRSSNRSCG